MRLEYVELMVSRDVDDLRAVLTSSDGELLRTRLPKLTRFVILEDHDESTSSPCARCSAATFGSCATTVSSTRWSTWTFTWPGATHRTRRTPDRARCRCAFRRSPHGRIHDGRMAEPPRCSLVCPRQANVLITGRPGSGKSTLLRTLAVDPEARRFRFYFDLGLQPRDEPSRIRRTAARSFMAAGPLPCLRPLSLPDPVRLRPLRPGRG